MHTNFKERMHVFMMARRHVLGGSFLEYLAVFLLFFILTCIFTDWIILDITHRLFIQGAGDGTSGFLWLNYADQDLNPDLGHTDLVNYPEGASIGNPTFITYLALWIPLWLLSRLFSPVVALNLVTIWGIMSGGLAMYWLVKRLTDNPRVALFAGFAVAFVPYHTIKSSMHLSYVFSIVFVLILAAFIAFWRRQTWRRAVLLAATIAFAYYTDGYFLLLASGFLTALLVGGVLYDVLQREGNVLARLKRKLRYGVVSIVALFAFVSPIIAVQLYYGDKVDSTLSQARSNIADELQYYASWPVDYLLPPAKHFFLQQNEVFVELHKYKDSRSNPGESTLYVGYVIILLCVGAVAMLIAYSLRRKGQTLHGLSADRRNTFLLVSCLAITVCVLLFSIMLPPRWSVAGHTISLPAALFIHFDIAFWRVLARFFLPFHVMAVLLAALALWVLFQSSPLFKKLASMRSQTIMQGIIVLILIAFLSLEYANGINRPGFDFSKQAPAYTWLKKQNDIKVIVEFPLVSKPWDYAATAVAMQMIHDKKLVNLHLPQQDPGRNNALVTIMNPEAIDYATARGAQLAVTQDKKCNQSAPWLRLAYDGSKDHGYPSVCMYYIQPASSDTLFMSLKSGFIDIPHITRDRYYAALYGNYAELWPMRADDSSLDEPTPALIQMELQQTSGDQAFDGVWRLLQEDQEIVSGRINDKRVSYIQAVVDASKPIQLRVNTQEGKDPLPNELSLARIIITEQ